MTHVGKSLNRQYVRVFPDKPTMRELFGIYIESPDDGHGAGRVYDFSTRRFFLVADANCRVVESYDVTGGLVGLAVSVADFGDGVVIKEWVDGSYHARVRDGVRSVVATISMITVQVPSSS